MWVGAMCAEQDRRNRNTEKGLRGDTSHTTHPHHRAVRGKGVFFSSCGATRESRTYKQEQTMRPTQFTYPKPMRRSTRISEREMKPAGSSSMECLRRKHANNADMGKRITARTTVWVCVSGEVGSGTQVPRKPWPTQRSYEGVSLWKPNNIWKFHQTYSERWSHVSVQRQLFCADIRRHFL
jgi:hypothetical protein